jgi:hypothetical protein
LHSRGSPPREFVRTAYLLSPGAEVIPAGAFLFLPHGHDDKHHSQRAERGGCHSKAEVQRR